MHTETGAVFSANGVASLGYEVAERKKKLHKVLARFLKTEFLAMYFFMQTSVLAEARTFMALRWYHFLLCASQYLCE